MSVSGTSDTVVGARTDVARDGRAEPVVSGQADASGAQDDAAVEGRAAQNLWQVGRLDPTLVKVLTVVGFAAPALAFLFVIQHYGVNAVYQDQWDDVYVIQHSYGHFLGIDWSSLWRQHTDNRMLFPNLIVVLLARTVHFNVLVEEYLAACMMLGATALLIWAHKRRSPGTPLLYYVPFVLLTLTLAQWQNMLWGFQMAWFLVLLAVAATLFVLDRVQLSGWALGGAIALAVVASYSSVQGLLIWPIGLLLLYHRRRPRWAYVSWVPVAIATTAFYFHHFNSQNTESLHWVIRYPRIFAQFFVFALGEIVGLPVKSTSTPANPAVMAFGALLLVLAVFAVIKWGIRRDDRTGAPIGVALILFGLLFAALITQGRFWQFAYGASQSRYVTNDVMVLAGIYLVALGAVTSPATTPAGAPVPAPVDGTGDAPRTWWRRALSFASRCIDRVHPRAVLGVALAAICIQVVFSGHYAPPQMHQQYQRYQTAARVTRTIDHQSDKTLWLDLYIVENGGWIRAQARVLQAHGLGPYG